jgi:hypothetical protein
MKTKVIGSIMAMFMLSACSVEEKELNKTTQNSNQEDQILGKSFKMDKTINAHLAKTQFYRWYQLYERDMNDKRIANQMEILDDDVIIRSAAGEIRGKKNYPPLLSVYKGWKNAHHVQNVTVTECKNNIKLDANIRYQNIQPNGQRRNYTIHYDTKLKKGYGNNLPKFTLISINQTGDTNDTFVDSYKDNRCKSLMHYWLSLVERLDGKVQPFQELLTNNFVLNFTSGQIDSIKKLEFWLNSAPKTLKQSNHYPENFSVKQITENEFEMSVEFDWHGITKDCKKVSARTKHVWRIIDNPNDRFAKIKKVDVTRIN